VTRGPLIAGVDLSTVAVHAALIPLDPTINAYAELRACRIRLARGRTPDVGEDLRTVRRAVHQVLADADDGEIVSVWIEQPPIYGGQRPPYHDELLQVFGAVAASVPLRVTASACLTPSEWRKLVELERPEHERISGRKFREGSWKRTAIKRVRDACLVEADYPLNDHEADAVLLALAGRHLTWQHHTNERRERHAHI
jgi:hypothetical protein